MEDREEMHQVFMDMAIEEAGQGIHQAHGGPFGSLADNEMIGFRDLKFAKLIY